MPAATRTRSRSRRPTGRWDVDTGFVVLNDRNYPNLDRLFDELGIATQPADMSFSVSDGAGRFEWASRPLGLFANPAQALDPRFHRMLADLVRFHREARALVGLDGEGPSLRAFLAERRYSEYFIERLIVPQVSSVWSADPAELWSFPASFLAAFFANHGLLQLVGRPRWRSVSGGSRRYVEALVGAFGGRLHLRAPVRRIERDPARCRRLFRRRRSPALTRSCSLSTPIRRWRCLPTPSPAEREVLGAIPYQTNETVLHTDERLLPRRRAARASWNYHLTESPVGRTTITYDMNRLQSLRADRRFLVTLNRTRGDRSRTGDPALRLRAPHLHARRRRGPAPLGRDQRPRPHPLLRGLLALGLPRGRRLVGAARRGVARRTRADRRQHPRRAAPERRSASPPQRRSAA